MDTIDDASNEALPYLIARHAVDAHWKSPPELRISMRHHCLLGHSNSRLRTPDSCVSMNKVMSGGFRPTERLSRFVSSACGLDALYLEVLRQAFNAQDHTALSRFKLVIGRILATEEPLSISAHSERRGEHDPADLVELIASLLGTLLIGVNQQHVLVRLLHVSFFDFLIDQNRSKYYHVDPSQHNRSLTLSTLRTMKSGLRFNICSLETSHFRNTDVPDLTARIENHSSLSFIRVSILC
jgi:hypothetical protein